ncbi:universal stress protein [Saccharopolyspora phatthalungensis]|uniref:Nucleotide-binding universal stress UspA family protein n=1 Tax=Saccharopolyspora phatthalungensis TaxID=664693 RepID=A0A840QK60_9PSEU|nr:universal stress protein [Saccharopolyspora phatthalungensis]MBB5159759.1 nucleotide-binding universal stress UspA family protein [Saccharopolyspora phatthalungensis]
MARSKQSVVVGVDGSESSVQAALWAAAEAARLAVPAHLVLVNDDPAREDFAKQAVRDIAERCHREYPELTITDEVAVGHPAEELVRRSDTAQLVVVGSRGHGVFRDALLGAISTSVAAHARCPVVVVRGHATVPGPVVVGVDNSPGSRIAVHYAFDAASRRQTDLVAVQALPDAYFTVGAYPAPDRQEIQNRADLHLAEQLSGWCADYPDVTVHREVANQHPVSTLCDAARQAQLLVVGHRGRGGFAGLLLGSVANGVLHHAPCPVAVIRTGAP